MKKPSAAKLLLPKLQAIILRTTRHLPCFMSLSASSRCFPFSCAIVHPARRIIVVAKHHHTTATFRHARAVRRRENIGPTREHATSLCLRSLFFPSNAHTTGHDHESTAVFQWVLSYFRVRYCCNSMPDSPRREHCTV